MNRNGLQHLGRPEGIGRLSPERPPDRLPEDAASRLDFVMDGEMALNGREISVVGNELRVRLYWQALRSPTRDYTMFLHVVTTTGDIVAQRDQQPAEGKMPAGSWPKGYIFADDMTILLPDGLPAGQYSLLAGLYDPATVGPLPVTDGAGRTFGTRAPIGAMTWPPQP